VRLSREAITLIDKAAWLVGNGGTPDEIEGYIDHLQAAINEAREDLAIQCAELDHHQQNSSVVE
jgi:hypothetical protein